VFSDTQPKGWSISPEWMVSITEISIQLSNEYLNFKDIGNSFPLMLAIHCVKQNPELANDADFI